MVSIISLWLPILLSAVAVFIASSVIHMVFKYHNSDFKKMPAEDEVMAALRPFDIPPGEYVVTETDPTNFFSTEDSDGGNDNSIAVTLTAGGNVNGNDFLDSEPAAISGMVLDDFDGVEAGIVETRRNTLEIRGVMLEFVA